MRNVYEKYETKYTSDKEKYEKKRLRDWQRNCQRMKGTCYYDRNRMEKRLREWRKALHPGLERNLQRISESQRTIRAKWNLRKQEKGIIS